MERRRDPEPMDKRREERGGERILWEDFKMIGIGQSQEKRRGTETAFEVFSKCGGQRELVSRSGGGKGVPHMPRKGDRGHLQSLAASVAQRM